METLSTHGYTLTNVGWFFFGTPIQPCDPLQPPIQHRPSHSDNTRAHTPPFILFSPVRTIGDPLSLFFAHDHHNFSLLFAPPRKDEFRVLLFARVPRRGRISSPPLLFHCFSPQKRKFFRLFSSFLKNESLFYFFPLFLLLKKKFTFLFFSSFSPFLKNESLFFLIFKLMNAKKKSRKDKNRRLRNWKQRNRKIGE